MLQKTALFLLVTLTLSACRFKGLEGKLCQAWRTEGFDIDTEQPAPQDSASRALIQQMLTRTAEEVFLKFYPDGKVAFVSQGEYALNQWSFDGRSSYLTLASNPVWSNLAFRVERGEDQTLKLYFIHKKRPEVGLRIFLILKENQRYEHKDVDLLAEDRNRWRVKPKQKESDPAIRQRVVDQISYLVDYFEVIEKNKQNFFETRILQSPFRFYQNGMGLTEVDNLPEEWKRVFYDEEDAIKAHALLASCFQKRLSYPQGTKTYTEGYAKFLKQIKVLLL